MPFPIGSPVSRLIGKPSSARERLRLLGRIGHALRHAAHDRLPPGEASDLLAYIALCLREILASVEQSTAAWEKRGYWLKADRFRLDWRWAEAEYRAAADALDRRAPASEALDSLSALRRRTADLPVPARLRGAKPWTGAVQAWAVASERQPPAA